MLVRSVLQGQIFLSHPHTNNTLFFLFTIEGNMNIHKPFNQNGT